MRRVGVLALQGDVPEHLAAIAGLGPAYSGVPVRSPKELEDVEALVLPGGESTTMDRLLREAGLAEPFVERVHGRMPVLATCAGLILMSREIVASDAGQDPRPLGLLDVSVRRNDFGRQRESFEGPVEVDGISGGPFPGVFIRAPRIVTLGRKVEAIARRGTEVVGVRQGRLWGLTFHPELAGDDRLIRRFLASTLGDP